MTDDVHEPLSLYRDRLKDEHAKNTSTFFEALVQRSGVNEQANRDTVAAIRLLETQLEKNSSSRSRWKFLRVLTILLLAAAIAVIGLFFWRLASPESMLLAPGFAGLSTSIATLVATILFLTKKLNPAILALDEHLARLKEKHAATTREAWEQLTPLNRLYDWGMIAKIIRQTVPRLALDPFFSCARLNELRESFGWNNDFNDDKSVLFAQSGEINGNPFALAETLDFHWAEKTWHGSLSIQWLELESHTDSNGRKHTHWVTRTQTLHASITKPAPDYTRQKFLIYGNEAAPDLTFSRSPSSHSGPGDGFLDKWRMKRTIQKLEKFSRNLDDDSGYTIMSNREFDALFLATNRNHEIQFRVLFTPLAQQQMVALLKDRIIGFGDDFHFVKSRMINLVQPAHLTGMDITAAPDLFKNYDLDDARRFFNSYSNDYFKHFYFTLAPLLTIPLYQQHRSHADIYKDVHGKTASFWEHEAIANFHGQNAFRHKKSITQNILKTRSDNSGRIAVTAHGFRGEERVEYVKMLGGDGRWHNVPVPWTEYLPVQHTTPMTIRETDGLTLQDFEQHAQTAPDWQSFLRDNRINLNHVTFRRSIASIVWKT
ncbi:MAG: hypothetical protein LBG65_05460 [Puniceicoccales bacterium]|jgi:hypothetical protein|nr:hypothetical protein [Puniceicoccales bacterium]